LLERDRELQRIAGFLQQGRQGHGGALVVEGPAGIGKTVLLAASRDVAEDEGFHVLRARGAELEREFAFGVVRQLIESVVADASENERARILDGPPGVAAELLGLSGLGATKAAVAPDPSFALLHGLYWLCANLATERPLALVVDDAHWADGASLRFLAYLLPRLEELHIAVLLGARPAEAGERRELLAALTMDPATEVLTIRPLTTNGVATLVAAGLGVEPEPEFVQACWEATGGTPFLVRTLVEALREERIAPVAASAGNVLSGVAATTLARWASLRLAQLGPDAARMARAVAVLERAKLDQAAQLAGLALLDAARAAELLVQAGVLDEASLDFTHPLIRGVVYRDMAIAERAEAHGQAARLLADVHASPGRVAEHLLATFPAGDGWVVEQLRAAGQVARASGAPESAAAYLRRALAEPPSPETRPYLLLELGLSEFNASKSGWHEHLEEAVESADNDMIRLAATVVLAHALVFHQRLAEAVEVCDRLAERLEGITDSHLILDTLAVAMGTLDAAVAPLVVGRASALLVEATDRSVPREVQAMAAHLAALANRPADQVADLVRRAIASGVRPLPAPGELTAAWFPVAMLGLLWSEKYAEAQDLLDAAVTEARAAANGILLRPLLALRAWIALRRSDLTAVEADARAVLDATGMFVELLAELATCVLVEVLVERGAMDEAERALEPFVSDLQGSSISAATLRYFRGRLLFAQRRFGEALSDFRATGAIYVAVGAVSPCVLPWRSDAALAALAVDEHELARNLSTEELALARSFGAPRALGIALRAAGLVAGGDRCEVLLREAVDVLAGSDSRLEHARAQTDLGAFLRRANRRVEARESLRQAVDTAHHLGAVALAERAETELRATGAKPRRVMLTGLEALTASERRIAELAADGLTNREIAQTLFITARTVEGHLTNVFNKLDVRARTELPTALATSTQAVRG
jgi:DNA-binding CsgD family transcriptional regulator/predicted negative regulator of RcsB-dependent stress response